MTQFSYSRVECFKKCPYQFGLRYIEKYNTIPNQDADNALIVGSSVHYGCETGSVKELINYYLKHYYCITDLHINEMIKLETMLPKVLKMFEDMGNLTHELEINTPRYKGFVDLIEDNTDGTVNIYDYKYCSEKSVTNYLKSGQLHVYKHYLETLGYKVNKLYYIIIHKTYIRQKKTETLQQFRQRLKQELTLKQPYIKEVIFDYKKATEYLNNIIDIHESETFNKNPSRLCDWCEYKKYCLEGVDYMILPKNERRDIQGVDKKTMWWYGAPFTGKTTLANQFPNPLMLNTDGNIKFVDAPYIAIKDKVEVTGRITNKTLAWQIFKDVIEELEKNQNEFKTIIVDLLEDLYEHCRIYMYDKLNIEHESDNSFKAWDMVRTEFLSTIKRLMNLDYENIIIISHEDVSKDITKKSGDKVTRIAPNLQEKAANKIAGMVDIVARIVAEGDTRYMSFKTSEVIFGGGRLKGVTTDSIPLEHSEILKVYDEAKVEKKEEQTEQEKPRRKRKSEGDNE